MSYAMICVIITNAVLIPMFGLLFWAMGKKNWVQWLLCIPSYPLMDIDHLVLTNVAGFGAKPLYEGQKIFHFTHTIEFVIIVTIIVLLVFLKLDPAKGRSFKKHLFPDKSYYTKAYHYYFAWMVRILTIGIILHWLVDVVIYSYFGKWDYLYISLIQYFLNPA